MRARSVPMGSMFGWIPATFRMVFGHFGAMSLATLITIVVWLVCTLPIFYASMKPMLVGLGAPDVPQAQDMSGFWTMYAICVLIGLVVMTPMVAGWMRLCHAADRGQPVSPMQILTPFRDIAGWGRLLVFAALVLVVVAAFGAVFYAMFKDAILAIIAIQEAQLRGATPPPMEPAVAFKILGMYVVVLPVMLLLQLMYFVGMSEVSLRSTSPVEALMEAAGGILRNLVKLLVFGFCLFVAFFIVMIIIGVVFAVLMVVLGSSNPNLVLVIVGLLYFVMIMVIYPLMFASNFLVWKDMLGDTSPPALTL